MFGSLVDKRRRFFENWIEEEEKSAAKLWACTATPVVGVGAGADSETKPCEPLAGSRAGKD